jgi:uncharacterized delta-60 repeat protein
MKKIILLLLSLQCSLYNICSAQNPGTLDNTFGSGGKVTMPGAMWVDVAVQPDGKVLAVSNVIARYNVNGTLDATFGINGVDTIKIDDTIYHCNAIGIQPNGKILVAGEANYNGNIDSNFLLIRYNTDGSLDNSFDGDGFVKTDINSGSDDYGYALAIQADGKIIVAGASDGKLALIRYHPDGSLDNTFDGDGKLVFNSIGVNVFSNASHAVYMKLQPDGKILVGSSGFLLRLDAAGNFDNSFGTNGIVLFAPHAMNDLAIQPDGKIVLAGGSADFVIVRLDTNGSFDNNFGSGGITTTSYGQCVACNAHQLATSIAVQPDGRILAGGYSMLGQLWDGREFVLVRYNQNGKPDSSFNSDGQVVTNFSFEYESHASAITPDFKIVLAGHSSIFSWNEESLLARYNLGWLLNVNSVPTTNENFVIAPNPTFDWINIEASKIENGTWHFELRDITGRLILQEDIVASGGSIQKKVSLKDLSAGLYFVQLDNDKNKMVSRVVKYR